LAARLIDDLPAPVLATHHDDRLAHDHPLRIAFGAQVTIPLRWHQSSSTRLVEENLPDPDRPERRVHLRLRAHCPKGYLPNSGGARITQDGSASSARPYLAWSVSVGNGQIGWFASGRPGREHSGTARKRAARLVAAPARAILATKRSSDPLGASSLAS
jgi:hypothetical protein